MKSIPIILCIVFAGIVHSQQLIQPKSITPEADYENIHIEKVADDALQTTFVIWVRHSVREHYHAWHTETVHVVEGSAEMTLGDSTFVIHPGDLIHIPKGTPHGVTQVLSEATLKVVSVQSPRFYGDDRIFTKP